MSDGSFCRISLALSRCPSHSSFWCSCRQRSEVLEPQISRIRSFLWPAQTWPTEKAALRAVVEPQQHRREILDLDVDEIDLLVAAAGLERFARAARLLALRDDGGDVAEHFGDPQAADVLREIAPVRADVAERGRRAALVGLEPPRVVGVLEQPVLQVLADEEMRLADVAARDREPRLLDQRVAAVVERDRVDDAGLVRGIEELLRLRRRHRQRLVGDDVLALGDRRGVDRVVQVVGRGVVHDLDVRIVEQRLVAPVGLRGAQRLRLRLRRGLAAARDRDDVDEAEPPDRIHVMGADKPGAHDTHSDSFHTCLQLRALARRIL